MKKQKTDAVVAKPEVLPSMYEVSAPDYTDAAERIRYHIHEATAHGRAALGHIIEAGQELYIQKQRIGYGQWGVWCEKKISVSQRTADKYIATFMKTVGTLRLDQKIPLEKQILKKELEATTVGMEEKTARQAMIEIGVIKPNAGHGGFREGAGRKPKDADVASELEAVATMEPVLWASSKGALDTLRRLDVEKDFMHRLSDEHLATVSELLAELAKKAGELLANRLTV